MSTDSFRNAKGDKEFFNQNNNCNEHFEENKDSWQIGDNNLAKRDPPMVLSNTESFNQQQKVGNRTFPEDLANATKRRTSMLKNNSQLSACILRSYKKESENKSKQVFKKLDVKQIAENKECNIEFSFLRAAKIMIYHLLFFSIGIFGALIIMLIEGYQFTRNLGFIGMNWRIVLPQYVVQILCVGFISIVACFPTKGLTYYEIGFLVYIVTARSFVIAVRYGFMSRARYKLYKSKTNFSWISQDLLLFGWLKMSPSSLREQVNATKHRIKILDEEWNFNFVESLPLDLHLKLCNLDYYLDEGFNEKDYKCKIKSAIKVHQMRKSKKSSFVGENLDMIHRVFKQSSADGNRQTDKFDFEKEFLSSIDEENTPSCNPSYKAQSVLREMLMLDSVHHGVPRYALCVVIIRILLQVVCQYFENNRSFVFHWYEYLITIWYLGTLLYIYKANLIFVIAGLVDFKRKLFLMKVLKSLISIDKDKNFILSSYFPTINLCCHKNLKSWMILREACLDVGKKYTYRIFLYCSVFLAFNLAFLGFLLMRVFGVFSYSLPIAVSVTGTYDVLFILCVLFKMLRTGAQVNACFDSHKGELIKIKKLLYEVKSDLNTYLRKDFSKCESRQLLSKMLRTCGDVYKNDRFVEKALDQIDMVIQDLEYQKETQPLKLLGFTASNELLTSVYTGLASLSFAIIQFFLSGL
ncbi:unnamed protein product [Moneuplotes crassus]|uniref:Uncharacterized protein n=1 Tax=Euplotes crassus TaxID=5936 RepID=A0AAD1Y7N3_EUPCR|nr:unnamed protein product [Moneuplotes crassus]